MTLHHLKVGDVIAIRLGKWHDTPTYEAGTVTWVGKKMIKVGDGRKFSLDAGLLVGSRHLPRADVAEWTDEIREKLGMEV